MAACQADMERQVVLVDDVVSSSEDEQPKVRNWARGAAAVFLLGTAGVAGVGSGLVSARASPAESMQLPPRPAMVNLNQELEEADSTDATHDSTTYPVQASDLRKNGYVMIKERPCKIVELSTSKTGKHGHAKVHITALDIFTRERHEDLVPATHNMDVPHVSRKDYQLTEIDEDGFAELMDDVGDVKKDLKLPGGSLGKDIQAKMDSGAVIKVTVMSAVNEEQIVGTK